MNQLDHLKKFSTISADTADIKLIQSYKVHHATTNPSLIIKAPLTTTYIQLLEDAILYAKSLEGTNNSKIINASDKLIVNIGSEILKVIPGHVSTEIDAQLSFNTNLIIKKAYKLINMYQEKNIDKSRVLIKIAATWEGIKAAENLEKSGIRCNLTLIFSFAQAQACAESGVYLISPFVGRIYDWYNQHNLLKEYCVENDPGIKALKKIYYYYKKYNYNTIIMGASFRTVDQILAISGCDCLTIAPNLLKQLSKNTEPFKRHLFYSDEKKFKHSHILSQENFLFQHNQNKMAVDKLHEGIHQFTIDQQYLNKLLINKFNMS